MLSRTALFVSLLISAPGVAACGDGDSNGASGGSKAATKTGLSATECGTFDGRGCAPASKRVDLRTPSFSNPTEIYDPLFPISKLHSALRGFLAPMDTMRDKRYLEEQWAAGAPWKKWE